MLFLPHLYTDPSSSTDLEHKKSQPTIYASPSQKNKLKMLFTFVSMESTMYCCFHLNPQKCWKSNIGQSLEIQVTFTTQQRASSDSVASSDPSLPVCTKSTHMPPISGKPELFSLVIREHMNKNHLPPNPE